MGMRRRSLAHSWTRGNDTAEIVTPISRTIQIRSFGWSKATPGPVSGPVKAIEVETLKDFEKYKGQLKGAVVLARKPALVPPENEVPENAYDAVIPLAHGVPKAQMSWRDRLKLLKMVAAEKPAVVLGVFFDPVVESLYFFLLQEPEHVLLKLAGTLARDDLDHRRLLRHGLVDDRPQRPVDVLPAVVDVVQIKLELHDQETVPR